MELFHQAGSLTMAKKYRVDCVRAVLLLLVLVQSVCTQDVVLDGDFRCQSESCSKATCKTTECNNGIWMKDPNNPCDCCPFCLTYLEKGEPCSRFTTSMECGPGLGCYAAPDGSSGRTCQPIQTPCTAEQIAYDEAKENGTVGIFVPRPSCDSDGTYAAKICQPGSTCMCRNEDGAFIFGEISPSDPSALRMNCRCSRDHEKALKIVSGVRPARCAPNGNYDLLQCLDLACFCVNHEGVFVEGPKPITDIESLSCYDPTVHVPSYYRPCEQDLEDKRRFYNYYHKQEMPYVGLKMPQCTPDGNYHRIQRNDKQFYCASQDGMPIENFAVDVTDVTWAKTMNCNCAFKRHLLENDHVVKPSCCPNGNFRPWQCRLGYCYCVDEFGFQITKSGFAAEVAQNKVETLFCYNNATLACNDASA